MCATLKEGLHEEIGCMLVAAFDRISETRVGPEVDKAEFTTNLIDSRCAVPELVYIGNFEGSAMHGSRSVAIRLLYQFVDWKPLPPRGGEKCSHALRYLVA